MGPPSSKNNPKPGPQAKKSVEKQKENVESKNPEGGENPTIDPNANVPQTHPEDPTGSKRKSQEQNAKKKSGPSGAAPIQKSNKEEMDDEWDQTLIPQCLCDEIYAELNQNKGDDDECEKIIEEEEVEEEQIEEHGTKRKQRRVSLPDVDGAIPKSTLRKLSNKTIRQLIVHAKKEVERFETENFLFERAIEKLERPEKAIDELYPAEEDDSSINDKSTGPAICSSESEEEPDDTGEYVAIKPLDEIHISTDSFFDNMSDNSKAVALGYFENIGEIAPTNFDVMRHKYGNLVKGAQEEAKDDNVMIDGENMMMRSRLKSKILESQAMLDEKASINVTIKPINSTVTAPKKLDLATMYEEIMDEDAEYPGFTMSTAKELSVEDKLRFALDEEEEFRHEFYKHETQALKEEGALQIHIDAHKHSIKLLLNLRKDFKQIMNDARHPLSGKLMAELILRFKRKMRNQISAEETKTRMTIRKISTVKKRAVHQLRTNKESGNAISQIDFEHLMCENQIFQDEMEEMNLSLKYLKQLSGHFFQILKEDQDSIGRLNEEDHRLGKEIETKRNVMKSFDKTYNKYRNLILDTNRRMDDLKRKLSEYHAPQPLEYIRLKAVQYEMESDVANLQKKLDEINLSLITARSTFAMYCKYLPNGDQTEFDNETWLEDVKKEVEDNNLMELLDEEDDEDLPSGFISKLYPLHPKPSISKVTQNVGRAKTAQTILLAPTRATKRRSIKAPVYDQDFEFELSTPMAEPSVMM